MNTVEPSSLTVDQIERLAQTIAREHGFDPERDEIQALVEKLGGKICSLDRPGPRHREGGYLKVNGPGDFEIHVSPFTGIFRSNFTLAHELGHYQLHSGDPAGSRSIVIDRFGDNKAERQANRFAAALLMPAERFRQVAARTDGNLMILSGYFKVSQQAVEARLDSLSRQR